MTTGATEPGAGSVPIAAELKWGSGRQADPGDSLVASLDGELQFTKRPPQLKRWKARDTLDISTHLRGHLHTYVYTHTQANKKASSTQAST